jgi:hypothetical protein
MPFILSTGKQKGDAATRKLIRSHVMLGKNKGKPRPSKRTRLLPWETVPAWSSSENVSVVQGQFSVVPKRVGSDWSFIQLADEIEPAALAEILKCMSNFNQRFKFVLVAMLTTCLFSFLCREASHGPPPGVRSLPQERWWAGRALGV